MTETTKTNEYKPAEEWLKWMEIFEEDDLDGKLRAMNYLLIQLVDCSFENKASLRRIENVIAISNREDRVARGGFFVFGTHSPNT